LSVPDLGARYREEDGTLVAKNPWFRTPPPIVELWEKNTPVTTRVDEPDVKDVLFRPSLATQLRFENKKSQSSWGSQIGYAYKPSNKPRIGYEYYLITTSTGSKMDITVHPDFVYHHVASTELDWTLNDWQLNASASYDKPEEGQVKEKRITQGLSDATITSLTLSKQASRDSVSWRVYAGLLNIQTQIPNDLGENAQNETQFEFRHQYSRAYRLGTERKWNLKKQKDLKARIEGTFDSVQEAGLFLASVDYGKSEKWLMSLQVDLIGATSDEENLYEKGFLRTYKANDNVGLSFNYVY
jgi:hypothetical protein